MIIFYHHYSFSGPTLVACGILFTEIRSFCVVFPSFCIHFEVCQFSTRKRIWAVDTQSS